MRFRSGSARMRLVLSALVALVGPLGVPVGGATEWYVAQGGTGAGTAQGPFGSIQEALFAAQPGDTVTIHPGSYSGPIRTARDGRAGSPLTVRPLKGRETVVISAPGKVLQVDHSYTRIDGLVFDGQYGAGDTIDIADGAHHFVLRNSEVRRSGRDCIDMAAPTDVLIEGTTIHHCLSATNGRSDAHGIVAGAVRRLTIRDCEIHTFSGDAFQLDPGRAAPGWDEVTIERAKMWLAPLPEDENGFAAGVVPGENAVDTKVFAAGPRPRLTIRDVEAWGFRGGLIDNMAAFNLKENVTAIVDRVTVRDSEIAFRLRGPRGGRGGAWVTLSNAVVHSVETAVRYEDDIENLHVWNSTIGANVARVFESASSKGSLLDVRNLLVLGSGLPREANDSSNMAVGAAAFVNAAAHDYRLVRGSKAVDRGAQISEVTTDRDGLRRPQGKAYDVGAYEHQQGR